MPEIYDGAWKLFDYDASTGRSTWVQHGFDGAMVFRVDQPVTSILEANSTAEKASYGHSYGEWNRAASVPLAFFHESGMAEAQAQGDNKFVSRLLNDSDYRGFRTSRGKV